jgi:hypothetical protein
MGTSLAVHFTREGTRGRRTGHNTGQGNVKITLCFDL